MLSILLCTYCWLPAVVGLGALVPYRGDPGLRRALSGFYGLGVLAAAAMLVHLVAPVGPTVTSALWLAGIATCALRRRWLAEGITLPEVAGLLVAPVLLVRWLQDPALMYDSGLYYLQTVAWTTERPLTLGLANLHGRLAFNSGWHVVSAALELPGLAGRCSLFANLLPLSIAAGAAAVGLERLARGTARLADAALALGFVVVWHATGGLGAASPDQACEVIVYLALVQLARALETPGDGFEAEGRAALLLAVLATTVKLSMVLTLVGAGAALWLRRRDVRRRWLLETTGLAALLLGLWMARSVALSGCLAYPVETTCLPSLPWAAPRGTAQHEADWIASWARNPNATPAEVLGSWSWLPAWAERMARRGDLRLFGWTLAVGLVAWAAAARRTTWALTVPLAVALAGIGFVFLTAPDPRFAFGLLHAAGLLPLAFGLSQLRGVPARLAGGFAAVAFLFACPAWARAAHWHSAWRLDPVAFPTLPSATLEERTIQDGARVRVPLPAQAGAWEDRCWAAPLPCTPSYDAALVAGPRSFTFPRR